MKYEQRDSAAWWLAKKFNQDPGQTLTTHIKRLKSSQTSRYDNFKRLQMAYEWGPRNANRDLRDDAPIRDKIMAFNHARNGINTLHSKICKSRVLPMVLTQGQGYLGRDRAKDLEKAIHGELRKNSFDELTEDVVRDGLIGGIGFAQVLHGRPSLTAEWVPCDDIVLDQAETRTRRPRSIYRRLYIDRYVLLDYYSEKRDSFYGSIQNRVTKLRAAAVGGADLAYGTHDILSNQVEVWCGWHLRSGEEADDGWYCVAINDCTLELVEWDRPNFPFAWYVPYPRTRQLHGLSVMQDLMAPQEEHDKITERIQRSNHLLGGTHLAVAREANVNTRDLNNGQGTYYEYDASAGPDAVKPFHPTIANEQIFAYRAGIMPEAFQAYGIPMMSATGGAPEGMDGASGKALQIAEEKGEEKLLVPLRQKDRFVVQLAWLIADEARAITETDEEYSVQYKTERRGLEKVEWKKVLLDREEFLVDIHPSNALAKSPSALFAQLNELLDRKAITVEQFRRLFELPDLEAENDVDMSDIEIIDKVMDEIVIRGKPLLPESFDYLKLILVRGRKFYNMCRTKDVPEDRLQLLRNYIERAKQMDDEQTAALAPQNQAMAGAPAPPVTDAGAAPPPGPQGPPPGAPPMPQAA